MDDGFTTIKFSRKLKKRIDALLERNDNDIKYRSSQAFIEQAALEKLEREKAIKPRRN